MLGSVVPDSEGRIFTRLLGRCLWNSVLRNSLSPPAVAMLKRFLRVQEFCGTSRRIIRRIFVRCWSWLPNTTRPVWRQIRPPTMVWKRSKQRSRKSASLGEVRSLQAN